MVGVTFILATKAIGQHILKSVDGHGKSAGWDMVESQGKMGAAFCSPLQKSIEAVHGLYLSHVGFVCIKQSILGSSAWVMASNATRVILASIARHNNEEAPSQSLGVLNCDWKSVLF